MALAAVLLAGGLLVLAVGADQLVIGASRLAFARGISPIVIGALVIGFGTSAPEMLVSGLAAADGDVDLGVGNIIGSNVANLSLVLGVSALVAAVAVGGRFIRVANSTLWREGVVSIAAALLFWLLVQDGLERWEGFVLLAAFVLAMTAILWRPSHVDSAVDLVSTKGPISQRNELFRTVLGLAATVVGAQLAVEGAVDIAHQVGLGSGFVGLSVVAFGTSLPELITGVQAARRGEADLLVGNILGSNTFNQPVGERGGGAGRPWPACGWQPLGAGSVDHGGHLRQRMAAHVPRRRLGALVGRGVLAGCLPGVAAVPDLRRPRCRRT